MLKGSRKEIVDAWFDAVDETKTEHGIPLRAEGRDLEPHPSFVKLTNRAGCISHCCGPRRIFTIVHIEVPEERRPYGGNLLTLCGKVFPFGTYFWPTNWRPDYTTCKSCHKIWKGR